MNGFDHAVFVTRYLPFPANGGDLLYTGQMLALLSRLGLKVTVFCAPSPDGDGGGAVEQLPGITFHAGARARKSALRYLFSALPKVASDFSTPDNRAGLARLLKDARPGLIVLDHIGSGWALDTVLRHARAQACPPRLVYITHNEETSTRLSIAREAKFPLKLAHYLDAGRSRALDRRLLRASALITCNSPADRALYGAQDDVPAIVLPPIYTRAVVADRRIDAQTPRRVVVVSGFQWVAKRINLDFFLRQAALPLTRAGIEVQVIGRMYEEDRRDFQARYPQVDIRGSVDRVEPFLAAARIGLLIDRAGGGFKHSVLTYGFNRVPVFALKEAFHDAGQAGHCVVCADVPALVAQVIARVDDFSFLNARQQEQFDGLRESLSDSANLRQLGMALETLKAGAAS